MTKVGQIIEEEMQQAIAEMRRQADEKVKEAQRQADEEVKEAQRQADEEVKENAKGTARKMLECGISIDQILQCINGVTRGELERMK